MSLIQNHFVPILHIHPQIIFHKKHSHFFLCVHILDFVSEFCDHPRWDWCFQDCWQLLYPRSPCIHRWVTNLWYGTCPWHWSKARQVEDGEVVIYLCSCPQIYIYIDIYIDIWHKVDLELFGHMISGILHIDIWWHMYIINYKTMCQKTVLKLMVGEHISHKHAVLFTCRFMWTEMTTRYYHTVLE